MNDGMMPGVGTELARFFLENPVPPGATPEWDTWLAAVRAIPADATGALLELLRDGTEGQQYGALIALRELGHEVWARDADKGLVYDFKSTTGETATITPR